LGVLSEFRGCFPALPPRGTDAEAEPASCQLQRPWPHPLSTPISSYAAETFTPRSHLGNQRRRTYPVATYYPKPRCSSHLPGGGAEPRRLSPAVSSQTCWASWCRPRPRSGSPTHPRDAPTGIPSARTKFSSGIKRASVTAAGTQHGRDCKHQDWDVTLGVPREAWAEIAAENQFNDPPKAGMEYWIVPVTATYTGDDTGNTSFDITVIALIEIPQVCSLKFLTCEQRSTVRSRIPRGFPCAP
jgi:hypothetical protein